MVCPADVAAVAFWQAPHVVETGTSLEQISILVEVALVRLGAQEELDGARGLLPVKQLYGQFVHPGDLVFNIGAHNGVRTAIFLELGARVVAVEPQEALCAGLRQAFANKDVEVVCAAAGPTEGSVELHLCTDNMLATCAPGWAEALKDRWPQEKWNRVITVPQVTIDGLMEEYGEPDFIKIDVEGYEDRVLEGLSRPVKALSFEYTVPYIEPALRALEIAEALGFAWFEYIIQESPELLHESWGGAASMAAILRGLPASIFYGDIFAVQEVDVKDEKKPEKKGSKPELPKVPIVDGHVVGAPGKGLWCIDGDVRRHVPDVETQIKMGIGMHRVIMLHPEQLEEIPEGDPMPKVR